MTKTMHCSLKVPYYPSSFLDMLYFHQNRHLQLLSVGISNLNSIGKAMMPSSKHIELFLMELWPIVRSIPGTFKEQIIVMAITPSNIVQNDLN